MKIFNEATKRRPPGTHTHLFSFLQWVTTPWQPEPGPSAVSKDANRGCSLFCPRSAKIHQCARAPLPDTVNRFPRPPKLNECTSFVVASHMCRHPYAVTPICIRVFVSILHLYTRFRSALSTFLLQSFLSFFSFSFLLTLSRFPSMFLSWTDGSSTGA